MIEKKWTRRSRKAVSLGISAILAAALWVPSASADGADGGASPNAFFGEQGRQMEYLDRGLVAVKTDGGVFVSWRLLGTDPASIAFNLYRDGRKLNPKPIADSTNYLDAGGTAASIYEVRPVLFGKELAKSEPANVWAKNDLSVPIQRPPGGVTPDGVAYEYAANDASVGDLDGDGKYEIVLKWDPTNSKDNSQNGYTGEVFFDAYKLDGTRLWRIAMGRNIRAGAHYSPFLVYDLDGDGKAEVAMRTADGTVDGAGNVIGDPNADYRNSTGRVLDGPEFLTIFDGLTGKALTTTDYDPPRGKVSDWGDSYGNRVDRFLACIAYLDGKRPSLVMTRGYYTRSVLVAYNWRDGKLTKLWRFDTNNPGYEGYMDQGNHNLSVADVDGDGKDEIIYGAMTVDDDGQGLYNTGLGHGDALHVGDLNPDRPGLEVFKALENKPYGAAVWDAATGQVLWRATGSHDTGRGVTADIDPRYPGEEAWAAAGVGLYTIDGAKLGNAPSSMNFAIWWDGDLLRELLDHNWSGSSGVGTIDKWDYENGRQVNLLTADGTNSNNWTKGNPDLQADLFGDWREEVIWRTADSSALCIYTTTDVTNYRFTTLMHDPVYRLGVAWQNVGYNQPPHLSYYLGTGMARPPRPKIHVVVPASVDLHPSTVNLNGRGGDDAITARIGLPDDYGLPIANPASVTMEVYGTTIHARLLPADPGFGGRGFAVKFDGDAVRQALAGVDGDTTAIVTGTLLDGNRFRGSGTFRVIH